MSSETLESKITEVQSEIEIWAAENNILGPGQRIIFSMRVETVPTVVYEQVEVGLDISTKVHDFFTVERFISVAEASHRLAVRSVNCIRYVTGDKTTVAEFLREYPTAAHLKEWIPNFGRKSLVVTLNLIRASGFTIMGDVEYLAQHGN